MRSRLHQFRAYCVPRLRPWAPLLSNARFVNRLLFLKIETPQNYAFIYNLTFYLCTYHAVWSVLIVRSQTSVNATFHKIWKIWKRIKFRHSETHLCIIAIGILFPRDISRAYRGYSRCIRHRASGSVQGPSEFKAERNAIIGRGGETSRANF